MLTTASTTAIQIQTYQGRVLHAHLSRLGQYVRRAEANALSRHPGWLQVLDEGLGHAVFGIEALRGDETCGFLPLAYLHGPLFGRFLVSLPYLNTAGVLADDEAVAGKLIERAVELADELNVRYLELRHEAAVEHPALTIKINHKVHMRLPLPDCPAKLWDGLSAKVRNQVRKGQKNEFAVAWGGEELLGDFYRVFRHNMRDLGIPVYGRRLFASVLRQFPERAEFCVVRAGPTPVAAALLLHGWGVTEVPSASSLRLYNSSCANMLLYWHLLERAVQRGQTLFDFGRSSVDSNTFRFKKQWGARPTEATWQFYLRKGDIGAARLGNGRYGRLIRLWQRLPVRLASLIGPWIVRGIP